MNQLAFKKQIFSFMLTGLDILMKWAAFRHAAFRKHLKGKTLIAQLKLQDNSVGRIYKFDNGKIDSKKGFHPDPDIVLFFRDAGIALKMIKPSFTLSDQDQCSKKFSNRTGRI